MKHNLNILFRNLAQRFILNPGIRYKILNVLINLTGESKKEKGYE